MLQGRVSAPNTQWNTEAALASTFWFKNAAAWLFMETRQLMSKVLMLTFSGKRLSIEAVHSILMQGALKYYKAFGLDTSCGPRLLQNAHQLAKSSSQTFIRVNEIICEGNMYSTGHPTPFFSGWLGCWSTSKMLAGHATKKDCELRCTNRKKWKCCSVLLKEISLRYWKVLRFVRTAICSDTAWKEKC